MAFPDNLAYGLLCWVGLAFACRFLAIGSIAYDAELAQYLVDYAGKTRVTMRGRVFVKVACGDAYYDIVDGESGVV